MATITNTCLPHYTITNTWHISYSLRLTLSPYNYAINTTGANKQFISSSSKIQSSWQHIKQKHYVKYTIKLSVNNIISITQIVNNWWIDWWITRYSDVGTNSKQSNNGQHVYTQFNLYCTVQIIECGVNDMFTGSIWWSVEKVAL